MIEILENLNADNFSEFIKQLQKRSIFTVKERTDGAELENPNTHVKIIIQIPHNER
jgi:hypothetical protein